MRRSCSVMFEKIKGEAQVLLQKEVIFLSSSSGSCWHQLLFGPYLILYVCASTSPILCSTSILDTSPTKLLHAKAATPSLNVRQYTHCMTGFQGPYWHSSYLFVDLSSENWNPSNLVLLCTLVSNETGKRISNFSAPSAWNAIQSDHGLSELVSPTAFHAIWRHWPRSSSKHCLQVSTFGYLYKSTVAVTHARISVAAGCGILLNYKT